MIQRHWSEKHRALWLCVSPLSAIALFASWLILILAVGILDAIVDACAELIDMYGGFFRALNKALRGRE